MSIKWVSHGSWWWTGKTGVLQYMGSQRVRRNWIELNWTDPGCIIQVTDWACIQVIIRYGLKDIWGKDGKDLYVDIAAKSLQSCPTLCGPIDGSPPRLPRPWDSPGKNTGVGCHFLLQCMKVKNESEVTQLCLTLRNTMDCSPPGSSAHGIFQARVLEWGAIAFSNVDIKCYQKKRTLLAILILCFSILILIYIDEWWRLGMVFYNVDFKKCSYSPHV